MNNLDRTISNAGWLISIQDGSFEQFSRWIESLSTAKNGTRSEIELRKNQPIDFAWSAQSTLLFRRAIIGLCRASNGRLFHDVTAETQFDEFTDKQLDVIIFVSRELLNAALLFQFFAHGTEGAIGAFNDEIKGKKNAA